MLTHSTNYSMQKNQVELRVTLKVDNIIFNKHFKSKNNLFENLKAVSLNYKKCTL